MSTPLYSIKQFTNEYLIELLKNEKYRVCLSLFFAY